MKIAMLGVRGVPATYGGAETHVEEVGSRLAQRGHSVTVFCRPSYSAGRPPSYKGMRLRYVPALGTKHLESISHTAIASLACLAGSFDIVHFHTIGPGMLAPLPRYLSRSKVVLTVHGRDSERSKWGRGAATLLRLAEWTSARAPDLTIVVSRDLERHYAEKYQRTTTYIPNGVASVVPRPPVLIREQFALNAGGYILFVGRLVPEKAPDLLIRAFSKIPTEKKLVVVGGSAYTDRFAEAVRDAAVQDPRVILTGYLRGPVVEELYSNAALFVTPSSLEGLPLVLLEAAAYGVPIVASDIPPHREILAVDGAGHRFFPPGDDAALMEAMTSMLDDNIAARRGADSARARILAGYSWESVVDRLEQAYESLLSS